MFKTWNYIQKLLMLTLVSGILAACGGQPSDGDSEDVGSIPPFDILGIYGGSDATVDGYLTNGTSAVISFESNSVASSYYVSMLDGLNTEVCAQVQTSSTEFDFSSCSLSEGQSYQVTVIAVTPAGPSEATNSPFGFSVDTVAPESAIDVNPAALDNDNTPNFEFSGTDASSGISIYQCRIDGGSWSGCTSPFTTSTLSDGAHTFEVRSFDVAGLVDGSPASYAWTVDATGPETSIDNNPPALDNDTTPTFEFSATDATSGVAGYECQIDSGGWFACTSPHNFSLGLGDGAHNFEVRAIDNAGNADASPSSYAWTISNDAPDPFVISGIQGGTDTTSDMYLTNGVNAHVYWGASAGATNYDVTIRNAADSADVCATQNTASTNFDFSACNLTEGTTYVAKVTAKDAIPNTTDASNQPFSFIVDSTAPDSSIDVAPSNPDTDDTPSFSFSGTDAASGVASYECRIDAGAWGACTSPITLGSLADGSHTFEVRAIDNAGFTDASPASHTWTIDTDPPADFNILGIQGGTDSTNDGFLTNGDKATVHWQAAAGAASYDVTIRNAADSADVCATQNTAATNLNFSACSLSEGTSYKAKVTAKDSAGLTKDATNNAFDFTVDTIAPVTSIDVAPADPEADDTPTFNFSATESGSGVAGYECRMDAGAWGACTSPYTSGSLASGNHTFEVRATDNAGNVDATPDSHTWQVDVTLPTISIDSNPSDPDPDTTPTFTFSGSDAHSGIDHYECRVDAGAWANCTSPHTTAALANGAHTFDVRAHDVAGNTATDSYSWTTGALTYKISGTVGDHDHGSVTLTLNGSENLNVAAGAGTFEFVTQLEASTAYSVAITATPTGPSIPCTLSNGSGTMPAADVTNLVLDCADLQTVTVSTNKTTLVHPDTATLSASGLYDDGITRDITSVATWTSTNTGIFSVAGNIATSVAAGTAQAQASFSGVSDTQSITVQSATLLSISVTPGTPDVFVGGQVNMTATGIYDNGASVNLTDDVTWTSSATGVATVSDTAGSKGLVDGVSAGTATITATLGAVSGNTTATVNAVTLTSLQVTPFIVNGASGTYADFEATGILSDGNTMDLTSVATWSSDDTDVASVESAGRILLVGAGSASITASYGGQNDSATVNVSGATLTSIAISGSSNNLPLNSTMQLTAIGTFSDSSTQDITEDVIWTSADESLISVSNQAGSRGEVQGLDATGGALNITATLSGVSDNYSIDVTTATLTSITISPPELMISKGIDVNFQAIGVYSDATEIDITKEVVWSSSNTSLVTIGSGAIAGGDMDNFYNGSTHQTLTVTATQGAVNQTANVILTPADLTSISVVSSTVISHTNKDVNMRAFGVFDDGGSSELTDVVTWTSNNESVVKISNGASTAGLAQTIAAGSATLTGTLNGISGNASMTVDNGAGEYQSDTGIGLTGYYYNGQNFDTAVGQRIDVDVDFNWASGTAPLGVDNSFSIRWQGDVKALYTETYTFCTTSDDGVRLWVDGVQIINNWTNHAATTDCGNIALTAGQKYDIQLEFYENGGQARIELYWQSASQAYGIIPSQYLYPVGF